jgi:multimeric flavodoxin WrbA
MKALVLDGSRKNQEGSSVCRSVFEQQLRQRAYEVETLVLRDLEIAPCKGCFGCWTTTPGICLTNDPGRELARRVIGSDVVVMLTPVTFGGYSSELKKVLDRIICLALPTFTTVDGVSRHEMRYSRYPRMIVAGILEKEDPRGEEIFRKLVAHNGKNFYSSSFQGDVFIGDDRNEVARKVASLV